jgi:hypothetical protein
VRALAASGATLALAAGLLAGTTDLASAERSGAASTSLAAAAVSGPAAADRQGKGKKGKKLKVVWDSTTFNPGGAGVVAHGKVPGKKRKLALQVKIKGGWKSFGKTRSDRKGNFAISGALDWYGAHKVRITTKGRGKRLSKSTTATVVPYYAPRGNPAAFSYISGMHTERRKAFAFNPCKTLTYAVNYGLVGDAGLALAQQAMQQMSWATGIKVRYVGPTTNVPHSNYKNPVPNPKGVDLVIAWGALAQVPEFQAQNKAGFGGPVKAVYARNAKGKRVIQTRTAAVTIGAEYFNPNYPGGFDPSFDATRQATQGEILIHEIGHAMGLDHVPSNPEEIMNGATYLRYPDGHFRGLYAQGDLAGLQTLGLSEGCTRPIRKGGRREAVVDVPLGLD